MVRTSLLDIDTHKQGFALKHTGFLSVRIAGTAAGWLHCVKLAPTRITCATTFSLGLTSGDNVSLSLFFAPTGQFFEPIIAYVERVEPEEDCTRIIFALADAPRHRRYLGTLMKQLLWMGGFLPPRPREQPIEEVITDTGRIQRIMRSLIANGVSGKVRFENNGQCPEPVSAARLEREGPLPLHWWMRNALRARPIEMELLSYNSKYLVEIERCEWRNDMLRMSVPSKVVRWRARVRRRVENPNIAVSFRHPLFSDLRVSRKVQSVSQYGIAFFTEPETDLLYPGLELPAIVVSAGERSTLLQGVIQHVSFSERCGKPICGVEIIPKSPFHRRLGWAHIVEPYLHPVTERGSAETVDDMWNLLDASGYFKLSGKNLQDFDSLREAYSQVSHYYSECPAMGCQVLWNSSHGLEATISIALMYSRTWLLYQLARRKGRSPIEVPGRQLIRDVYVHAFEHAQWYPSLEWVLAYTEANVRWHHLTHQAFAERYGESGKVLNMPFRLMEDSSHRRETVSPEYEIGDATTHELGRFLDHTIDVFPPAFRDALDFVPSRFYLEDINRTLTGANLSRERYLFVARRDGEPVAAALMETGTKGMHLFRLCDGVRVFSLADDADDAVLALMEHARRFYEARGKDAFVYYMQPNQFELGVKGGLIDLGEGYTWLVHASLISDFLEHIYRLSAPRDVPPVIDQIPGSDPG